MPRKPTPRPGAARVTREPRMNRPRRNLEPIEFDDHTIAALVELGDVLRSIHNDLVVKGFQMKDGILTPPSDGV